MSHYLIQQIDAIAQHQGAHLHRGRRRRTATDHLERLTLRDDDTGDEDKVDAAVAVRVHRRRAAHRLAGRHGACATSAGSSSPAPTCSSTAQRPAGWALDRDRRTTWRPACPGVFVAGDVRAESVKRVASAVGEGAMAVMLVHRYLEKLR